MKKMKILITGGLGAVGAPLAQKLIKENHEVWVCDLMHSEGPNYIRCDIAEYREIEQFFDEKDFDFVYHLAAEFGRNNGEDYYERLWRTNAIGTKNILRMQERKKFKLIFTSSSEVYGDYPDVMNEDVMNKYPIKQMNDYAISKWVNEMQILNSSSRFKTESVIVRLFNTYGPGEYFSEYRSVICQFIYKALHNLPYTVFLNHKRTSSYIDDTVITLSNIIKNFKTGQVYNIAGDEFHDIKMLSDMVLKYLGKNDNSVKYINSELFNTKDKKADIEKVKKDLNHKSITPLSLGIPKTIEWQKKVYAK